MQTQVFQKIAHPWLLGVSLLVVGIFAGAGIQMLKAQTTPFTEPTCNPGEACNPNAPLLGSSSSTQTISSDLNLNGNLALQTGKQLQTAVGYAGMPINVTTTDNFTIVANTSSGVHSAMQANGTGSATGLWATSVNGNAIRAIATGSGLAGYFQGNVDIGSLTNAGSLRLPNGGITASNTISGGRLHSTSGASILGGVGITGGLTVNGQPVAVGETRHTVLYASLAAAAGTNTTFTGSQIVGSSASFRLVSYQVFSTSTAAAYATNRTWAPASALVASLYTECSASAFSGSLKVTNNSGQAISVRVMVTYQTDPVPCGNPDVTPPTVSISSPISGTPVTGATSITITASDVVSNPIQLYELLINGNVVATSTTSGTFSHDFTNYPFSPPNITVSGRATDNAGNKATSLPIEVSHTNALCSPACTGITSCIYFGCTGPTDYRCWDPNLSHTCGGGGPGET
ncbi:MAG: Ig-like domain-containing protein [Patescibacteria group bacterium]|jgi:hypothetical protein